MRIHRTYRRYHICKDFSNAPILTLISLTLGVLAGISIGVISAIHGLRWWSLLTAIVGIIVGVLLTYYLIYPPIENIIEKKHCHKWSISNPELPDLNFGAVQIDCKEFLDKIAGKIHYYYVLMCQCDR